MYDPVERAREILASDALIVDTETTGLASHDECVEIAVITLDGTTLLHSLVKPSIPVHPAALAVHGICDEMLADAPDIALLWPAFLDAIGERRLLAWNASFDRRMLMQSARRAGLPWFGNQWSCLMRGYGDYQNRSWRTGLETACNELGLTRNEAHRALGDALDALAVLRCMGEAVPA